MLVWLAGARLHAGRSAVPFAGADAAWLVAFARPPDVAASTESRTLLLFCILQHAGSLTLAPHTLSCILAQPTSWPSMMPCQYSVPCSKL